MALAVFPICWNQILLCRVFQRFIQPEENTFKIFNPRIVYLEPGYTTVLGVVYPIAMLYVKQGPPSLGWSEFSRAKCSDEYKPRKSSRKLERQGFEAVSVRQTTDGIMQMVHGCW